MISLRGPKLKILAGILGAIALAAGIYLTFFHSRGFIKNTGTIVSLREDTIDGSSVYYPTVEYTVDGKTYSGELDGGSDSYKVGKTIPILYDPADPSVVHGGDGFGIYCMAVGALILVVLVWSTVQKKRGLKQLEEHRELHGGGWAPSVQGEERELYFLSDTGTAKVGHRIEDRNRRVLYEAKMTKFTLTSPYGFDFIDHEHGHTTPHLVGHEEESEWNSFLLETNYTFELDGVDIWKYLKNNGIDVTTERMEGTIWPRFRIMRDGNEIAILESSSQFVHEEDAEQHSVLNKVAAPGFYRIWTREETLDAVFVTAMAFARSRALNDEGGSFGKQIRSGVRKRG
ncbi:MAG: DUF3592 domain-containing protein [Lachnospiraceae bacterium]|nr:DUF3592 domain-containing protein [Lachnospiraceae bacterium]